MSRTVSTKGAVAAGLSRRDFTAGALALAGVSVAWGACSGEDEAGADDTDVGEDTDVVDTPDTESDGDMSEWARGGTAQMAESYEDPFVAGLGTTCALTCELTLGPCYSETVERRDISEGVTGLPVRLALKVVDESCAPVAGAVVDIWHTSYEGLYSGEDAAAMCTAGDAAAKASRWFRGLQITDAAGRVDFNTCFPGWYRGRAIHIHFQVRRGEDAYVTSQLFFQQALIDEIFESHPEYSGFGAPDTRNDEDGVLSGEDAAAYLLETERMSGGVMMAHKTIVLRSSLASARC